MSAKGLTLQGILRWLLICAAVLLSGCERSLPPPASPPVALVALVTEVPQSEAAGTYSGEVRARFESKLSFRVPGKIVSRHVHLGDEVKPGQVLAELDHVDLRASLANAEQALSAAQTRLTYAAQQRDRNLAQAKEDLVSRAEVEQTESAFAVAQADLLQARAAQTIAGNQFAYTSLVADHAGIITAEDAEVGSVVTAGQPVFGFAFANQRDVFIDVPEDRIGALQVGAKAKIELTSAPGAALAGTVREIALAADPQSRTFRVKVQLPDTAPVRIGMTAVVAFPATGTTNAWRIPASALFHDGEVPAIWVVEGPDHHLVLQRVKVASYGADTVTLTDGARAGQMVLVEGVHTVSAGERVQPHQAGGGSAL